MPRLGDFVGALLADAMRARVSADLETVRLAETYSRHDLLRHLPVPRFRMPDLVVDVPVLIGTGVGEGGGSGGLETLAPTATELRQAVAEALKAADVHLPRGEPVRTGTVAVELADKLFAEGVGPVLDHRRLAGELAAGVADHVRSVIVAEDAEARVKAFQEELRERLTTLIVGKVAGAPSLDVLVGAEQIRSHQHSESIVRLRITLTEDAYEVVALGDDGFTLTPE